MSNETKKPENKFSWSEIEKYFASEVIEQARTSAKRWFIAWMLTLIALIGTNAYWIYVFNSYDYVSQDGSGVNTINTGKQEDMNIGTENED